MEGPDWLFLPPHVVVNIFLSLDKNDRFNASQVCRSWSYCFRSSQLWKTFRFHFKSPDDFKQLKFLEEFDNVIRTVIIHVNQSEAMCRLYGCRVLKHFARLPSRKLENVSITFTGENPLLYSGHEFHESLSELFASNLHETNLTFKEVNLSGLKINLDPSLIYLLASNHSKTLKRLNIQNGVFVVNNHPGVIKHLVSKCHQLTYLHLYGSSIDNDVIFELTKPCTRKRLKVLSIYCRRDQKYVKGISSEAWISLVKFSPEVKVTLGFDHNCLKRSFRIFMKPEIPVNDIIFETRTFLSEEIKVAAACFNQTLTKLTVISTPQYDSSLDDALIFTVNCCRFLNSLHVFYVLKKETVDYILSNNEQMRKSKTYTLRHWTQSSPWMPAVPFYL